MMNDIKIAGIFGLMASMADGTPEQKVEWEANILFKTPGIFKPEDWDELSLEDKQARISKCRKFALGGE